MWKSTPKLLVEPSTTHLTLLQAAPCLLGCIFPFSLVRVVLFTFSFELMSVPRIREYKHAQLEYKHVGHRDIVLCPHCADFEMTDTPQLLKQQRVFLVLRQQVGLAI